MAGVRPPNGPPNQFAYGAGSGGATDEQLDINGTDGAPENSRWYLTPQYGNTSSEPVDHSLAAGNQISSIHQYGAMASSRSDAKAPASDPAGPGSKGQYGALADGYKMSSKIAMMGIQNMGSDTQDPNAGAGDGTYDSQPVEVDGDAGDDMADGGDGAE